MWSVVCFYPTRVPVGSCCLIEALSCVSHVCVVGFSCFTGFTCWIQRDMVVLVGPCLLGALGKPLLILLLCHWSGSLERDAMVETGAAAQAIAFGVNVDACRSGQATPAVRDE